MLTEVMIPIGFFALIYGIIHLLVRRKERMALIDKGLDASIFYNKKGIDTSLKYGLLLVGSSLGLIIGNVLSRTASFTDVKEVAYFAMVFLFGGLSLVIYYFLLKRSSGTDSKK
ncbi:MAG: hypothetical protein JXA03_06635 [Bacteroidales bacterium]|nr:hypothetical protein [Bacteroidales bacterium]